MKRLTKAAFALTGTLFASQLYAQPTTAKETAPGPVAPAPKRPLSPDEMKTRGVELVAQMRVDAQHVQHLQGVARQQKDVIKLSCVNDKFVRLKAESNLFDTAYGELLASIDTNDRFVRYDHVTSVAASAHKAREEADACVGAVDLGDTSESSFTAPEIPDDPTGELPFEDSGTVVEPPGYASPYS